MTLTPNSKPLHSVDTEIKRIVSGVYEQGVVDEHGDIKPGEMIYPELAVQPSKAIEEIKTLLVKAQKEAILSMHDSIMRHELPLGDEADHAFNYARIHRWIDKQASSITDTELESSLKGGK